MSFWARLSQGLQLISLILAAAFQLDQVGATLDAPAVYLTIQERRFRINAAVTRES